MLASVVSLSLAIAASPQAPCPRCCQAPKKNFLFLALPEHRSLLAF